MRRLTSLPEASGELPRVALRRVRVHGALVFPSFPWALGFNWSFYLVQQLHEHAVLSSLDTSRSSMIIDGRPAPALDFTSRLSMPSATMFIPL